MCLAYTPPSSSDNEHVKSDQSVLRLSCIKLAPWLLSRQVSNAHLTSPSAISLDLASSTQWPQRRRGFDGSLGFAAQGHLCARYRDRSANYLELTHLV